MAWTAPRGRELLTGLFVFGLGILTVPPVHAGKNPDAKLILHLVPYTTKNTCLNGEPASAAAVVTKGSLYPARYTAYVVIVDGSNAGFSGCQFGIAFNDTLNKGVDVNEWQECSLFNWPMPGWPVESRTGNLLTWNQDTDCDTSGVRVAGYFDLTAHGPDRLSLIVRPVDGKAAVASCGITPASRSEVIDLISPDNLGFVDFGGGEGYNPWDPRQNLARFKQSSSAPGGQRKR
jgi:hypothetical protein